ncbi:MAG: LysR family transcriptional regulator [Bacillota bacterium]|nr:LysR family transcriptional regulator [Bacillota bacterium]MDW7684040.1 LysR family transcriptional regulator [Bacillota bacterium]
MQIDNLKAFCMVVESGSISKAAKKLFVSQPSLSVKIQDLENYYQAILLERTNKGVRPTDAGLVVYQNAQKIISLGDNIERQLEKTRSEELELVIGASSTIGNYALPCTIYNFKEKYPLYKLTLDISNSEHVVEKVIDGRVEIGLIEGPLSPSLRETLTREGIGTKRVATNALILVVHNNGRFADTESIDLEHAFRSLPLIVRETGSGIRTTLEMVLAAHGLKLDDLNVVLELNTTNAIVSAVTSDKGVSLLPRMAIRKELHYKILREITVNNTNFRHDITTLYRTDNANKPLHATFLNFLHSRERGFC